MHNPSPSAPLSWPELPDEVAVALQGVLHDFVMLFESHYLGQIERYYRERSRDRARTSSSPTSSSLTCSARPTQTTRRSEPLIFKQKRRRSSSLGGVSIGRAPSADHRDT